MAQFRVEFVLDQASGKYLAEMYHPDRHDELIVRTEALYPSQAAAVLGVTQSALSQTVRALEERVAVRTAEGQQRRLSQEARPRAAMRLSRVHEERMTKEHGARGPRSQRLGPLSEAAIGEVFDGLLPGGHVDDADAGAGPRDGQRRRGPDADDRPAGAGVARAGGYRPFAGRCSC